MALITVLMWSTLAPAVKLTMTEIPTLEMLSITAGLAFLFLLLYNGIRGKLSLLRKKSFRMFRSGPEAIVYTPKLSAPM